MNNLAMIMMVQCAEITLALCNMFGVTDRYFIQYLFAYACVEAMLQLARMLRR